MTFVSVPEHPSSREHHRDAVPVACVYDLAVLYGSAWLDDEADAGLSQHADG